MVTCSRRLENPARLRLPPSLFLVFEILVMQMRGGGTNQRLYKGGRADHPAAGRLGPAAPLPGGLGGQQAGRPAGRATGPRDLRTNIFAKVFAQKPLPPLPPLYKGWLVPHPSFASLKFQKPRKKREGGRAAKPCRIFEPATAGNQNSSTLYK